jgi:energy-coupling factor transporter ATP-binding protein EcfA2
VVELRAARKRFGQVEAVRGIDLTIRTGELVAMLGPNGAGKTTSISLMLGLRRPSDGQARLFGLDPADRRARSRCYWSGHHAAPAIANLIYLPLSFASGLFSRSTSCPVSCRPSRRTCRAITTRSWRGAPSAPEGNRSA